MKKLIAVIFILSLFTPELSAQTKVERELLFNLRRQETGALLLITSKPARSKKAKKSAQI